MSEALRILTFGGCGLSNAVGRLRSLKKAVALYSEMGFRNTPFALSSPACVQLLDFVTLKLEIPEIVRRLSYGDAKHVPDEKQAKIPFTADVIAVEMSTPIEYLYEGFALNINRFEEVTLPALKENGVPPKLVSRWRSALLKNDEETRKTLAAEIYAMSDGLAEDQQWIRQFIASTVSRRVTVDRMVEDLDQLRTRLNLPLVMVHHNFQYMPDGRPVSWPPDFKDQSIEVAKRLGVEALDYAPFVQKHGTSRVMAEDNRHWNPSFYTNIAEHLHDFVVASLEKYRTANPDSIARPAVAASETKADETIAAGPVERSAGETILFDHETGSHVPNDPDVLQTVILLGQSWAMGANSDKTDSKPATKAPEHPGYALMFDAGVCPRGRAVNKFVELTERVAGSTKETPCSGMADQILRTWDTRFDTKPQMLFFGVARGGTTLAGIGQAVGDGLLKGSAQHLETVRLLGRAKEIAASMGKRIRVLAICLAQGESDFGLKTSYRDYKRRLSLLQQAYDADIRAITGQFENVPVLTYQTNRAGLRPGLEPTIPLAQLHSADSDPMIRCIGPVYANEPENVPGRRSTHLRAIGYRKIGQQFGRFIVDDILGAGLDPLRVVSCRLEGVSRIFVQFTMPVALEKKDGLVNVSNLGEGLGIDVCDSDEAHSIKSVDVSPRDPSVLIVTLRDSIIGPDARLFVAARATGGASCGKHEGARSGIRSAKPYDHDPLDGKALYHWACTESVDIKH